MISPRELALATEQDLRDAITGKLRENSLLLHEGLAAVGFGGHQGKFPTCPTARCAETRLLLDEHARRAGARAPVIVL